MRILTLDIETNSSKDYIHCCGVLTPDYVTDMAWSAPELERILRETRPTHVLTWYGIEFDIPKLEQLWGIDFSGVEVLDGILLSRLHESSRAGGHSLASWGDRLKFPKGDFTDYDAPADDESRDQWLKRMEEYCLQDVRVTLKAYEQLKGALASEGFSEACIQLEHDVTKELAIQRSNGFLLDLERTNQLYAKLTARQRHIEGVLQRRFPPIVTERWSEKTGKRLKDKVEVFNVGSRQQIVKRLQSVGVKFTKTTESGQFKVDETILGAMEDNADAQLIAEYLIVQKRASQVSSWLENVEDDGRVHGRVFSSGAATGRMTHSKPNMAQIPAVRGLHDGMSNIERVKAEYGKTCRQCWSVPAGKKLVGCDASGLELRMLAHYMKDDEYTRTILEGDVHTANQQAAGLETRDQAKTFIYAFLYGAGDAKIGSIAGKGAAHGRGLKQQFLDNVPALKKLSTSIETLAETKGSLPGLDGRRIKTRKAHSALNFLLQGGGAAVMKAALLNAVKSLRAANLPFKIVANVHDELQVETDEWAAVAVGKHLQAAIRKAGDDLKLRCPMDAEYHIGNNWAETH